MQLLKSSAPTSVTRTSCVASKLYDKFTEIDHMWAIKQQLACGPWMVISVLTLLRAATQITVRPSAAVSVDATCVGPVPSTNDYCLSADGVPTGTMIQTHTPTNAAANPVHSLLTRCVTGFLCTMWCCLTSACCPPACRGFWHQRSAHGQSHNRTIARARNLRCRRLRRNSTGTQCSCLATSRNRATLTYSSPQISPCYRSCTKTQWLAIESPRFQATAAS